MFPTLHHLQDSFAIEKDLMLWHQQFSPTTAGYINMC